MFTYVEKLITSRNLKPKKKEGFLKIISAFSFVGIMLGVAVERPSVAKRFQHKKNLPRKYRVFQKKAAAQNGGRARESRAKNGAGARLAKI